MSDFLESSETALKDIDAYLYQGYDRRRQKAAVALTALWGGTFVLHISSWGSWAILCLTVFLSVHALRVLLARSGTTPEILPSIYTDIVDAERLAPLNQWPYISILVAAKNEEAVIESLVEALLRLDYPKTRYDRWVINDNSTDRTPERLDRLAQKYDQLSVVHRPAEATGGKSGALNSVWMQTKGDILAVFDADAQAPPEMLRQVIPFFDLPQMGAVQVRKAIANSDTNFWTRGQQAEMALDAYWHRQRSAVGGIGELRGNGQFVRRTAIERCGGWNEETITDDLDLTLRLHLNHWDIQFLTYPAVKEEGVTSAIALWHQRSRWAEGGYQRYLDYWRLIVRNRLGFHKTVDLFSFWIIQYLLPTVAVPDLILAIARNRTPVFSPIASLTIAFSIVGMFIGLRQTQKSSVLVTLIQTLRGTLYMLHWFVVVASTTARISVRPKRLKWVKTVHQGKANESPLDISN